MILKELQLWIDESERDGAGQMAVDEAIFLDTLETGVSMLRIYQWMSPVVTIGYFDEFPEYETRPVIRRMTGGGLVEHGQDVTFCLTLSAGSDAAKATTEQRYRWIHEALLLALADAGVCLTPGRDPAKAPGPCFSTPVKWDLLDECGKKVVGGAQRKSRGAVIHQGSILLRDQPDLMAANSAWIENFAEGIATQVVKFTLASINRVENSSSELSRNKYGTTDWSKIRKIKAR